MPKGAALDLVVHGASGFTGRLVVEHLLARHGAQGPLRWAVSGRDRAKLEGLLAELGAAVPVLVADAADAGAMAALAGAARAIITTVGPYQLHGAPLLAACAAAGTDYLDLSGEPLWMAAMIAAHEAAAKASGARILFSCGFDSIPFELGVMYAQKLAVQHLGRPLARVAGRVLGLRGGLSGGTAASGRATMAAIAANPSLLAAMFDPFLLTPGFVGPEQPRGDKPRDCEIIGAPVGPFMMAAINTKNVHRSHLLQGHPWGAGFRYDEMAVITDGRAAEFPSLAADDAPRPGEGPSRAEREAGFYDLLFVGVGDDGRQVRARVHGDMDPGYGSTSKLIAETACLLLESKCPGGIWTPGAALGTALIERLHGHAGLTFSDATQAG